MKKLEELRDYYDTHDTSQELAAAIEDGTAVWETDTVDDPMITTSLRLPRSKLSEIRAMAAAEDMKPTAMMRRLIDEGISSRSQAASTPATDPAKLTSQIDKLIVERFNKLVPPFFDLMNKESSKTTSQPRKTQAKQAKVTQIRKTSSTTGTRKTTTQPARRSQPSLSPAAKAKSKGSTPKRKG